MTPSAALATVLVDELVRGGVRDIVLAPGSRSAPLAYAVLAAERAGRLRLHVRVDERSAGYLAVGLAKGSGSPAVVVTTSGTAVANLHPAVLEASHAGVPLVVLSADRPHELRGTGANQTTTQPRIFAGATRFDADLPAPDGVPAPGDPRPAAWRTTVCRALAAALALLGGEPGPVHVNACFREPLVPDDSTDLTDGLAGRPGGAPWTTVAVSATPPAGDPVDHVERTVVVVGEVDEALGSAAATWAAARAYPVVAEPFAGSSVRAAALPHGPLVLTATDWLDAHAPARVVVVGRPTLARPVAALLRRPGLRVEAVCATASWADPGHRVAVVHPAAALNMPDEHRPAVRGEWAAAWDDAGSRLAAAVTPDALPWPTGLAVARTVHDALPEDSILVLGSSNPVRDLDLATAGRHDVTVVANRGLAGIDGVVATAAGVSLGAGRAVHALLGDLTFLHDTNGLLVGPAEPRADVTYVVVNDDGGGIFTTLEPGAPERAASFDRLFGTPTGTDLAALCRAHGVRHAVAGSADALAALAGERPDGLRVVEVRVDRTTHRQAHADLRALAARALRP